MNTKQAALNTAMKTMIARENAAYERWCAIPTAANHGALKWATRCREAVQAKWRASF